MTLPRQRWVVLLLVAMAARALTFGNPIVHPDEQFYFVVAKAMWHGQLPYLDIWDRKPLGLFLLYMPAALLPLPWGTLAYQATALACVVATATLIARFAERSGWRGGALPAAAAYILWLDVLNGASGQSPVFYNLPVAGAAWLVATRRGDRRAGLVAMALIGLTLQIKPAAVFEGLFLGLWLLADAWRTRTGRAAFFVYGAALAMLALLPTAAAYGVYAGRGAEAAWWQANVTGVLARLPDPPLTQLRNGLRLLLLLSPLIAMAGGSRGQHIGGDPKLRVFLRSWLAVAIGGVIVFGGWYDHYGLPVVVPAAVCAAGFLGGRGRRFATPILLLVALAGQLTIGINRSKHGDGETLAAIVRAVGRGPGTLFVYSGDTLIYPETGRPAVTRYLFPSHLYLAREEGTLGVPQAVEIRRILATRPDTIVVAPGYRSEEPHIRAMVMTAVARDYVRTARLRTGNGFLQVFRLRDQAASRRGAITPS